MSVVFRVFHPFTGDVLEAEVRPEGNGYSGALYYLTGPRTQPAPEPLDPVLVIAKRTEHGARMALIEGARGWLRREASAWAQQQAINALVDVGQLTKDGLDRAVQQSGFLPL